MPPKQYNNNDIIILLLTKLHTQLSFINNNYNGRFYYIYNNTERREYYKLLQATVNDLLDKWTHNNTDRDTITDTFKIIDLLLGETMNSLFVSWEWHDCNEDILQYKRR